MRTLALALALGTTMLVGCGHGGSRGERLAHGVPRTEAWCGPGVAAFDCDRRAILAMVGNYRVSFHFDETTLLDPGYLPRPAKDVTGTEAVVVVSDEPRRIELQHLLVLPAGMVVKHWRQVWVYEAADHFRFLGAQQFDRRTRTEQERTGTWTQLVYEVSDAPRYAGSGTWVHQKSSSTWASETTLRPLPRREYSSRKDYDLIIGENRHTITPLGWTHEQDNTKVIRRDGVERPLVREFGFNEYTRINDPLDAAQRYWKETAPFWAVVRARWETQLADGALSLAYPVDEETLLIDVLKRAEAFRGKPDLAEAERWLDTHFAKMVRAEPAAVSDAR